VSRAKNGSPSVHPLSGVELRALRRLKRDQEPPSPFVFTSERGAPFTTAGWRKMVARLGVAAKLGFKAHPHMFRHACGFQLANQGTDTRTLQAYLGHRNIQHTVRYTELSPTRFKNLWRESLVSTSRRTSAHSAASTADGLPFDLQHQRQAPEKALAGGQCSIYALANV
jgi:integrase